MNKVAILTYQGSALFELGCAVELFGLERPELEHWYSTEVVSFEHSTLQSSCNVSINVKTIDSLNDYSMLIIPSWPTIACPLHSNLKDQIIEFHQQSKTIISFCSGAFLLAEIGILNNRQATTHWRYANLFKQRFGDAVEYVDDVLYVYQDNVGTSAGSAAAIDLGLEVIRRQHGNQIANQVARRLVMAPHRKGGQSQYIETPVLNKPSAFDKTLSWALENLNSSIVIADLANKSHMSRRSFDRQFRKAYGCSPKDWLTTQRLELAKLTLEKNQISIEQVASATGFDNANALRHHFRKKLGVSPRQYRDQFSSPTNHLD